MSGLEIETGKIDPADAVTDETQPEPARRPVQAALPLLLEVGCEEIPARFLRDAEKGLGERVAAALGDARLLPPPGKRAAAQPQVQTFSTPRRLTVHVPKVLARQPDKVEEILGPPVKVAIAPDGRYTRAAESFAQKNSARLEDLTRVTTPKGEYLSVSKTTAGRPAGDVLSEILPATILGLSFPKSMYWTSKSDARFVRPIRWVLAILGEGKHVAAIDFDVLGVPSADFTFGHRALGRKALLISGFKRYMRKLKEFHVEIDYHSRVDRILQEAQALQAEAQGKIVKDDWLVDWIANATEWPRPILGSFDPRFLHLPREILITVMRDHQRYFALEDEQGNLRPNFVAVLNMDSDAQGLIRQGHQRVLAARFRDAEFFWNADQKIPLRDRRPLLDKVTYQARLGSYGDKVHRMFKIADELCASLEDKGAAVRAHVRRAVELSKCDLTTQMVQEFTELQGTVGGLYAKVQGEAPEVADAIYDHYLPMGAEGASPRTLTGALVSLADKFDSVVAGFAAGNEPTGSSDPFALRRQANGIIKVILELSLPIDLQQAANSARSALDEQTRERPIDASKPLASGAGVLPFFAERLRYYFESVRHFRYDTVRAVLAAGATRPADAQARAEAMEALRGGEDFEALSAAAKRIRNILAKSASAADWQAGEVDRALLSEEQEKALLDAYVHVAAAVQTLTAAGEYRHALELISTLRPAVDRFFDKVLVMAEDPAVRQNRLRLLKKLDELFSGIAHFAEIEGQ